MVSWLGSILLIVGCGLFVSFEFAIVKIAKRELEQDAASGISGARVLLHMKQNLNAFLAVCQFGITLTSLGLTLVLEPAIHRTLAQHTAIAEYSALLAMLIGAFFHVTFGELVPKGLALVVPRAALYRIYPFMQLFYYPSIPFIRVFNSIANLIVRLLTGKDPDRDIAQDDGRISLTEAALHARATGQITPEQFTIMKNVIRYSERTAREVMTPARDVVALDLADDWKRHLAVIRENGYSRYPVIHQDWDNVIGYVRAIDILEVSLDGRCDLRPLIRPIERRPETVELRQIDLFHGSPMVACFDEHDQFVGILTGEDAAEQILGEIYDETDDMDEPAFRRLDGGRLGVDGSLLLDEAAEYLGLPDLAEEEDVDTLGGLVIKRLGKLPRPGDQIELGPYRVTVAKTQGFKIHRLLLAPVEAE